MARSTIVKPLLLAAGLLSAGMALFHFVLPDIFQWPRYMAGVPDSIVWGMFAINAFFSFLLLLGAVATIRFALSPTRDRSVLWGMALFWAFNAAYQIARPFPQRTVWVGTLAFAAAMLACYVLALRLSGAPRPRDVVAS